MGSLWVYSYIAAEKTPVHPIFVWQPSRFIGELLFVLRPDSSVPVALEINVIQNSTYGNESFTIAKLNYFRGQHMSLRVDSFNVIGLATFNVTIPNSSADSLPVVCLEGNCFDPIASGL
jgi:hypothetical protein